MRTPVAVWSRALVLVAAGASGCALAGLDRAPPFDRPAGGALVSAASPGSEVAEVLASVPAQTGSANGLIWLGYNLSTAERGDFDYYDTGDGTSFGIGFGNGQDVKRFFEVGYEQTGHHDYLGAPPTVVSTGSHARYYLGIRQYIFPVAGRKGRTAPFVTGGLTVHKLVGSVTAPVAVDFDVFGMGLYVGTGTEAYLGSSQFAISAEVRASAWNWDAYPGPGTGRQATVGCAVDLVYHF